MKRSLLIIIIVSCRLTFDLGVFGADSISVKDSSPLWQKAEFFQQDLLDKHWLDGLYISIVPATPSGARPIHTVDEPGNVIHAGVWTGRYLAGVGYQFAASKGPSVREHGWEILRALRILQEVTGKPGLLARGYVKGHGPVEDWERDGRDSVEWHQGQGAYSDYRWYGDVSVDNLNAVLFGYAVYYDLAADKAQRAFIAQDVDRLMTHLLDNHCRIIDVDGEVTRWGHVGMDPDPARDEYYKKQYARYLNRVDSSDTGWRPSLRSSLMLLPDLLIAYHITGKPHYLEFYHRVVNRFKDNPEQRRSGGPFTLERLARTNHSSEGQAYEALYNLIRYESDPALLVKYRTWVNDLWEMNWMEGNSLFAFMTLALLPEYRNPIEPGNKPPVAGEVLNGSESLRRARDTLKHFPIDRVFRPVMNSLRNDIELNPHASRRGPQSAKPIPINERPLDNEYTWKGNPYQLDGWSKPTVRMFQVAWDDPQVAWFCDSNGRLFMARDNGESWQNMSTGLMGARVENIVVSTNRTFLLFANTDQGIFITRDGGMSWRPTRDEQVPEFQHPDFNAWLPVAERIKIRINGQERLERSTDNGQTSQPCMNGWRIARANSVFSTPWGIIAGGPGGCYRSSDGLAWTELKLWREDETGAADFLHAYWMGRYYGFINANE